MQECDKEYNYLIKLWFSPYTKRKSVFSGRYNKPKTAFLQDIRKYLGFSITSNSINLFINKMIKNKIFVVKEKVIANPCSKTVYKKYIIDGDKAISYLKTLPMDKSGKNLYGNRLYYGD